ncbi:MAG: RHS repeat domain-containing protein, partial [Candidatus Omnitrophota bacterium]|nr:RHS repeat domain-containing protein [Candidatus Omnitrophota bacterium]
MILSANLKPIFKTIAASIAAIFLWQQISWAADLIDITLQTLNSEQSHTFGPAYLQDQQASHEALIDLNQNIENFAFDPNSRTVATSDETSMTDEPLPLKGPQGGFSGEPMPYAPQSEQVLLNDGASSFTTSKGDIVYYQGSAITSIRKKDGTVIGNITLDAGNNLIEADIRYPDSTLQLIREARTASITTPEGSVFSYNAEGLVESVTYPDGASAAYSYIKDVDGSVLETIVTDADKYSHYDAEGRLIKVTFTDGRLITYDSGILLNITEPDGTLYSYKNTPI